MPSLSGDAFPAGRSTASSRYTGERKAVEEWRRLVEMGLHWSTSAWRLAATILRANKPGPGELIRFVHDLKEAGVAVGLIAMVGVGGKSTPGGTGGDQYTPGCPGPRDLVYLSFIEHPDRNTPAGGPKEGSHPSEEAIEAELNGSPARSGLWIQSGPLRHPRPSIERRRPTARGSGLMAWLILFIAGLFETAWALFLKQSHGLTRFWPTVGFLSR